MLIVAGNRKSATAEDWHGKMANLLRFAPFRVKLKAQEAPLEGPRRETAQTAKPSQGQRVRNGRFLHLLHFYTANTVGQSLQTGYGRRSC